MIYESAQRSGSTRSGLNDDMTGKRTSEKFKLNFFVRVKLEGLSAQRWTQFESIKFSLFIHLLHMDKTETLQNLSILCDSSASRACT